jgi:hypothetical protein
MSSAYLPHDSDKPLPAKELSDVTDYAYSRKKQLIAGHDTNAHHILWGCIGTNLTEGFMKYLVSSKLNILDDG